MTQPAAQYNPAEIEPRWQAYWERHQTFHIGNPGDPGFDDSRPKYYILDMFPYTSGSGLHVGHPEGYTATDIVARYKRMRGFNVLHPIGWDSFGLPAEQHAVQTNVHPRITTENAIERFRDQLKRFGFSYDWDRELATTDVKYYRWTQWIFLQLFHSWFDPAATGRDPQGRPYRGKARPIAELMEALRAGTWCVSEKGDLTTAPHGRPWSELPADQQRQTVDRQRLAYMDEVPVNWCPMLGTVLANEEVTSEGRSERGDYPVYRRPLRQWMLRITRYCERLIQDLDAVDWPESIKTMQRNWVGRSVGAEVVFKLADPGPGDSDTLRIFTTRPDTLLGATYMVLAPEHPWVRRLVADRPQRDAVLRYVAQAARRSELERTAQAKDKTGVATGAFAVNPVSGEPIPIWVADYVLLGYGTGAIMAVPAHDLRDCEFALQFDLPIRTVVQPPEDYQPSREELSLSYDDGGRMVHPFTGEGIAQDSGTFTGLPSAEFKTRITEWLEARHLGRATVNYKLRDWLFSRQRYWGEPIPILHGSDGSLRALDASELPLDLPHMEDFKPHSSDDPNAPPQPPLGRAGDWVKVQRDGQAYRRELNTMPQWAGSCWYYLRYLDPGNDAAPWRPEIERYWMNVDQYVGGAEHAVLHLLYARFWHKVLYDLGHVSTLEPFQRLYNQGLILSFAYKDRRGMTLAADQVEQRGEDDFYCIATGEAVERVVAKMSKGLKNVVNPDTVLDEFGADTFRLYEMYMGPLDASKPWNTRDIPGLSRFLARVWRLIVDPGSGELSPAVQAVEPDDATRRSLHKLIRKVGEDVEAFKFNTAIAEMIAFTNQMTAAEVRPRGTMESFVLLLSPFAPHICEELWQRLGHQDTLAYEVWPAYDPQAARDAGLEIVVQVNGKLKSRIQVDAAADAAALEALARADRRVQEALAGKTVRKVIVVPGKLVNFVVG